MLRELEPGQVRQGRVSSICDFGAFVDIGGADGLIHLSEISWKRVGHPSEVLKVGDMIDVYVLSVDPNERKIALSLKRTQPEPWSTITDNYKLGQIVRGTITQLTTFGAFARLDDGIEGLIHVSELAEGRVAHPKNVVNVGDVLDLKVIRIDPIKRRIGLSLKRVHEDENGELGGAEGLAASEGEGAAGTAPTRGAYGEENAPAMSQTQVTEANSLEGEQAEAAASAPTPERNERFERAERPRAERPERGDRGDRGGRQQNRQTAPTTDRQATDDAPMGALAQALGAFMNRDDEEPEETDAAPVAEEKETAKATKKAAPVAEEPTTSTAEEEAPAAEDAAPVAEEEAPAVEDEAPAAEEEAPAAEEEAAPASEEEAPSATEDAEATEEKATEETES